MMIERRLYKCCTELNEFSNHHRYTSCKDYYKDTLLSVRSNSGVRHIKCCSGAVLSGAVLQLVLTAVLVLCFLDSTSGLRRTNSSDAHGMGHLGWRDGAEKIYCFKIYIIPAYIHIHIYIPFISSEWQTTQLLAVPAPRSDPFHSLKSGTPSIMEIYIF
jgi:hypothetical protein